MHPLELKTYPDPCLRIKTHTVTKFGEETDGVIASMKQIMYENQGIGLAATQVGLGLSVFLIDTGDGLMECLNPEIVESSKKKTRMEEGCLSLPGINVSVKRSEHIKIRAQNNKGEFFLKKFDGLMAKAIQHEMDHLQGKLIIDHLDPIRFLLANMKLTGLKRKLQKVTA